MNLVTLENLKEEHKKYRWFKTRSGKIVVGGKSAEQNDQLLKKVIQTQEDLIVMHTKSPGSPFSIILESPEKLKRPDLQEAAQFTACFSQQWKKEKPNAIIDIFSSTSLSKPRGLKTGTWNVKNKLSSLDCKLELFLTKQSGILRAVPESTIKLEKDKLLRILPGKTKKEQMLIKLQSFLPSEVSAEEILSALPPGGIKIPEKND